MNINKTTLNNFRASFNEAVKELEKEGLEIESKHQGLDNFRKYLEESHEIRDYLFNKFKKALEIK